MDTGKAEVNAQDPSSSPRRSNPCPPAAISSNIACSRSTVTSFKINFPSPSSNDRPCGSRSICSCDGCRAFRRCFQLHLAHCAAGVWPKDARQKNSRRFVIFSSDRPLVLARARCIRFARALAANRQREPGVRIDFFAGFLLSSGKHSTATSGWPEWRLVLCRFFFGSLSAAEMMPVHCSPWSDFSKRALVVAGLRRPCRRRRRSSAVALGSHDALHLLAAGIWLGGLLPLAILLRHAASSQRRRFLPAPDRDASLFRPGDWLASRVIATGGYNAWTLVGGFPPLFGTAYGRLLLLKLGLLLPLLAVACRESLAV